MSILDFTITDAFENTRTASTLDAHAALIREHLPSLLSNLHHLDPAGFLEYLNYGDYGLYDGKIDGESEEAYQLVQALVAGIQGILDSFPYATTQTIPTRYARRTLVIADENDMDPYHQEVLLVLQAAETVEEFGEAIGILGLGIRS